MSSALFVFQEIPASVRLRDSVVNEPIARNLPSVFGLQIACLVMAVVKALA
jgi:hypothetical protein